MAYDEVLAGRLDGLVKKKGLPCRKMFGGIAYFLNGNMCFGVHKDSLVLRLSEEEARTVMKRKHVRPFDITGRPMKGWVLVEKKGIGGEATLKKWTDTALGFVKTLPKK